MQRRFLTLPHLGRSRRAHTNLANELRDLATVAVVNALGLGCFIINVQKPSDAVCIAQYGGVLLMVSREMHQRKDF